MFLFHWGSIICPYCIYCFPIIVDADALRDIRLISCC